MSLATLQAAHNILKNLRAAYDGKTQTRAPADERDFRHLDLAAYRRFRADMEARGYRFLADYEIVNVSRARSGVMARTFIRTLVSADGATVCSYYQSKQRLGKRLWMLFNALMDGRGKAAWENFRNALTLRHCVDIGSDFPGGRSVSASNAEDAGKIANPPAIETHFFPYGTPLDSLLQAHTARLAQLRAEAPDLQPLVISTVDELFRLQDQIVAQKAAYRRSVGWITRDELRAMASGNETFADAVYEEIRNLLAREADAPAAH